MAVIDLWYLKRRGADDKPIPSKRHGRGNRWRVDWIDPDTDKPRSESFAKKEDAKVKDAVVNADISRGQYIDPVAGKTTVEEYAKQWIPQQIHDDSTAAGVERFFRLHVYDQIGHLPMSAVKSSTIQTWVKGRQEHLAGSSIGTGYIYLKAMFAVAQIDNVIGRTPCVRIALPVDDKEDRYIPKPKEVHALAEAVRDRWRPIIYLAAGCGMRASEIFGLELSNVDFLRREVRVEQQLKWTKVNGVHIAKVKTPLSRRTLELPDGVGVELAKHIAEFPPVKLKLHDRCNPRKVAQRDVELLFTTSTKRPLYGGGWSKPWPKAVTAAELPAGFGLHGLRHYFATLLIHNGKNVKTVQLALGHSSPVVTLGTYVHDWPDGLERTRSLIDAELFTPLEEEENHG